MTSKEIYESIAALADQLDPFYRWDLSRVLWAHSVGLERQVGHDATRRAVRAELPARWRPEYDVTLSRVSTPIGRAALTEWRRDTGYKPKNRED